MSDAPVDALVAGAGVAGLEALLALRALAGDRVRLTVLTPADTFVLRAASVGTPFGRGRAPEHPIAPIAAEQGARLVRGALQRVRRDEHVAVTHDGEELRYGALVVAVGAVPQTPYPEALTFHGPSDADAMAATLRELEAGRLGRIAFVLPPGITWPLPLYELALLTAAHAELYRLDADIAFVTPDDAPLAALGAEVSRHAARALDEAGVTVHAGVAVRDVEPGGALVAASGDVVARADAVVTVPRLHGPAVAGLPANEEGFLPVDERGAVPGAPDVFGAGDATASQLKHGGLGAQQAEAVARAIAQRAGAAVVAPSQPPVIRARLLEGPRLTHVRAPVGASSAAVLSDEALWWPPLKVAAPRLAAYLASRGSS